MLGMKKLSPFYDLKIMLMTLLTVFGKDYKPAKQVYGTAFAASAEEAPSPEPAEAKNG